MLRTFSALSVRKCHTVLILCTFSYIFLYFRTQQVNMSLFIIFSLALYHIFSRSIGKYISLMCSLCVLLFIFSVISCILTLASVPSWLTGIDMYKRTRNKPYARRNKNVENGSQTRPGAGILINADSTRLGSFLFRENPTDYVTSKWAAHTNWIPSVYQTSPY